MENQTGTERHIYNFLLFTTIQKFIPHFQNLHQQKPKKDIALRFTQFFFLLFDSIQYLIQIKTVIRKKDMLKNKKKKKTILKIGTENLFNQYNFMMFSISSSVNTKR